MGELFTTFPTEIGLLTALTSLVFIVDGRLNPLHVIKSSGNKHHDFSGRVRKPRRSDLHVRPLETLCRTCQFYINMPLMPMKELPTAVCGLDSIERMNVFPHQLIVTFEVLLILIMGN